ncbi:MAG TPA: hypothetical protein VF504_00975, partial [Solirubrobacterales bacterium]
MKEGEEVTTDADRHEENPSAGAQGKGLLTETGIGACSRPPGGREPSASDAQTAYDRYAPVYDESNAQNDYEMWLGEVLLPELEKHGLRNGWALDV